MRRPSLFLALAAVAAVAIAGVAAWHLTPMPGPSGPGTQTAATTAGPIQVGGPFELTAHTGETVTETSFGGKLLLVFFGYTFCPDICPTTLNTVALALDELGAEAASVQPLFITVDPARDTPSVLADYVTVFHPSVLGLAGTPEQTAEVAKAYRAYYAKVESEDADPEDYLMDHSVMMYLMGPDGRLLTLFSHTASPQEIAAGIRKHLAQATS